MHKKHRCINLLLDRLIQFRSRSDLVEEECVARSRSSLDVEYFLELRNY